MLTRLSALVSIPRINKKPTIPPLTIWTATFFRHRVTRKISSKFRVVDRVCPAVFVLALVLETVLEGHFFVLDVFANFVL